MSRGFWQTLDLMRGIEPVRCDFVKLGYRDALNDDLGFRQCMYYLHWRDNLERGRLIATDDGYVRLWMTDVFERDIDPEVFGSCIAMLQEEREDLGSELQEFADCWHTSRGHVDTALSDGYGLAAALMRVPAAFPRNIFEMVFGFGRSEDRRTYGKDLGRALRGIDIHLRAVSGSGLVERITEITTDNVQRFKGIIYRNGDGFVTMRGRKVRNIGLVKDMLDAILGSVMSIRQGMEPKGLHGLEDVIARSIDDETLDFLGPIRLDDGSDMPIMHPCGKHIDTTILRVNSGDVRFFRERRIPSDYVPVYVPSTDERGDLDTTLGPTLYYTYWRRRMDEGEYIEADDGYVMLLMADLLSEHSVPDIVSVMDALSGIHAAYGTLGEGAARMAKDISVHRAFPYPVPSAENVGAMPLFLYGVASGNRYDLPPSFLRVGIAETWEQLVFTDDKCSEVFRRAFATIMHTSHYRGGLDVLSGLRLISCRPSTPLYSGFRNVTRWDLDDENGRRFLADVLDEVVHQVNGWDSGDQRWFSDIVASSVEKARSSGWRGFDGRVEPHGLTVEEVEDIFGRAEEHPFEPCGIISPDRGMLSADQLRYYAYWCRNLENGTYLPSELGYVGMRVREILDSDMDGGMKMAQLDTISIGDPILGCVADHGMPQICIREGLTLNRLCLDEGLFELSMMDLLSHPVSEFDMGEYSALAERVLGHDRVSEDDRRSFNTVLARLDSYLAERGTDIPTILSKGYEYRCIRITTGDQRSVRYEVPTYRVQPEIIEDLIGCIDRCSKKMTGSKNARLTYRRYFTKGMADAAMDGSVKVEMSRKHPVTRKFPRAVMFIALHGVPTWNHDGRVHDGPPPKYTTSGIVYGGDTSEVCRYYAYWKGMVQKNVYLDTDNGYVRLYLNEIVGSVDSPESKHSAMMRLRSVYDPDDRNGMIWEYITAHALSESIPLETCGHSNMDCTAHLVLRQIASGKGGYLTVEGIAELGRLSVTTAYRMDERAVEVVNALLRECASVCGNKISAFRNAFGIRTEKRDTLCPWLGVRKAFTAIAKGSRLEQHIKGIVDGMDKSPSTGYEGDAGVFGPLHREDIVRIVDEVREARRRRVVVLDMGAVKDAESDLAEVTDLMRIDDGEDVVADPAPTEDAAIQETVPTDSPWDTFRFLLTSTEMTYLRDLIAGIPGNGRDTIRTEESVNRKAMDTVGDVVVENGIIVDDYSDDIRRIL